MDHRARYLQVRQDDLRTIRFVESDLADIAEGQALLRVRSFGLSSNNVTYGATGDSLGYWRFFPVDDGWGQVPVWGFADVVASRAAGVGIGSRVYGYLPMGTHLVVQPRHASDHGFADGAAHRADLPAVYNRYQLTRTDPLYSPDDEGWYAVLMPLFVTALMLEDYLLDSGDFGAERILLSSASSKTAASTAHFLSRRDGRRPHVVGLTSPEHVPFVSALGCYDEVVAYPDLPALDTARSTVYVDVAGNAAIRASVHAHLAEALRHSCAVGIAHWDALTPTGPLPGPRPTLFFAPTQVAKRLADWGPAGYRERLASSWASLVTAARSWIRLVDVPGLDGLASTYKSLLDGETRPDEAFAVSVDG